MKLYGARRDKNEPAIIEALRLVGAAVQQLDPPLPDLLVSFRGELSLLEVKDSDAGIATRAPHRNNREFDGDKAALTPAQVKWWSAWKGKSPVIVHNPVEALAAIGASRAASDRELAAPAGIPPIANVAACARCCDRGITESRDAWGELFCSCPAGDRARRDMQHRSFE